MKVKKWKIDFFFGRNVPDYSDFPGKFKRLVMGESKPENFGCKYLCYFYGLVCAKRVLAHRPLQMKTLCCPETSGSNHPSMQCHPPPPKKSKRPRLIIFFFIVYHLDACYGHLISRFTIRRMEYLTEFVTNCVSVPTSFLAYWLSEQVYEEVVCCVSGYLID